MAQNATYTATTTSTSLPLDTTQTGQALHVTLIGSNPVTLKVGQSGNAVYGEGVVLAELYQTFSIGIPGISIRSVSVITSTGTSALSFFYA